jgi:cell division transport system permease protein
LRRPFLYFGTLQGALAGLVAAAAVALALRIFIGRLGPALADLGLPLVAWDLPPAYALVTVAAGAGLGWLGALLGVRQHRRAEP